MNDIEQKLTDTAREIRESYILKKDERVRIAENILSRPRNTTSIPSPYQKVKFPHFFFMNYSSIALLFLFMFTGVLSYIAENALPGDPLYNVKTNFNENLQSLLTVSPESNAKLQTTLVKKRLEEAQLLAAKDGLTSDKEKALASNFKKNFEDFKQSIKDVDHSHTSATSLKAPATSTSATSTLAYETLHKISLALDALDTNSIFAGTSTQTLIPLSTSTASTTVTVDASSTASVTIATSTPEVSSTTPAITQSFAVENHIIIMQTLANDGISAIGQGDFDTALSNFQKVLVEIDLIQKQMKLQVSLGTNNASSTATSSLSQNSTAA